MHIGLWDSEERKLALVVVQFLAEKGANGKSKSCSVGLAQSLELGQPGFTSRQEIREGLGSLTSQREQTQILTEVTGSSNEMTRFLPIQPMRS